ncbi:hypothetical protein LCGC14_2456430 [marine sediment metagenome]|uniref:Uncharacterized protein n=1 Tax=marine sediment metagenome TaxID=412755 RepID=A0A0F9E8F3_9ZZZZ
MNVLTSIREKISGYKTYIVAVIAILTALVAWSSDTITLTGLVGAIFAAVQTMFIRAGVAKIPAKTIEKADTTPNERAAMKDRY